MLDPLAESRRAVSAVLASLDLDAQSCTFLARGAISEVWKAETTMGPVAIRLGKPSVDEIPRFAADATVRRLLLESGGHVTRPIALGVIAGREGDTPWSVDALAVGKALERGHLPESVSRELGAFLRRMHALSFRGYGLLKNRPGPLFGSASNPGSGLVTRLVAPWPYGGIPLSAHAITRVAPALVPHMLPLEGEVRAVVELGQHAVSHTDLHRGQLLVQGSHLATVLDFGDAAVMPRAWDMASFALFHGWARLASLLQGYEAEEEAGRVLRREAELLAVPLALHHVSRAEERMQPGRIPPALHMLRGALRGVAPTWRPERLLT
jgi:hypothetical protein